MTDIDLDAIEARAASTSAATGRALASLDGAEVAQLVADRDALCAEVRRLRLSLVTVVNHPGGMFPPISVPHGSLTVNILGAECDGYNRAVEDAAKICSIRADSRNEPYCDFERGFVTGLALAADDIRALVKP